MTLIAFKVFITSLVAYFITSNLCKVLTNESRAGTFFAFATLAAGITGVVSLLFTVWSI